MGESWSKQTTMPGENEVPRRGYLVDRKPGKAFVIALNYLFVKRGKLEYHKHIAQQTLQGIKTKLLHKGILQHTLVEEYFAALTQDFLSIKDGSSCGDIFWLYRMVP